MGTPTCWILSAFLCLSMQAQDSSRWKVEWSYVKDSSGTVHVQVTGFQDDELAHLKQSTFAWHDLFPVFVEPDNPLNAIGLPPMLGHYAVDSEGIRFTPQFPLAPGVQYRAYFYPQHLPQLSKPTREVRSASIKMEKIEREATTVVEQVFPTRDQLPENLLKFYLQFSAPMSGGAVYQHIRLVDEDNQPIELPFLELDEELWDHEMKRLTLFIDPGRIKRGVKPLEDIGPALEAGSRYTLIIDSQWQDSDGIPLKTAFQKSFTVVASDRSPPHPKDWIQAVPKKDTRQPYTLSFGESLDHALARRLITIVDSNDRELTGLVELKDHESRWQFIPDLNWQSGDYKLIAQTTLEDLAGNNIGKPFEVDLFDEVERKLGREFVTLEFSVR